MSIYHPEKSAKALRMGKEMLNGHICSVWDSMQEHAGGLLLASAAELLSQSTISGLESARGWGAVLIWCRLEEMKASSVTRSSSRRGEVSGVPSIMVAQATWLRLGNPSIGHMDTLPGGKTGWGAPLPPREKEHRH